MLPRIARRTIVNVWPVEPKNISFLRPTRSISPIAIREARKYSVALQAAIMRELVSEIWRRSNSRVWWLQSAFWYLRAYKISYSIVSDDINSGDLSRKWLAIIFSLLKWRISTCWKHWITTPSATRRKFWLRPPVKSSFNDGFFKAEPRSLDLELYTTFGSRSSIATASLMA